MLTEANPSDISNKKVRIAPVIVWAILLCCLVPTITSLFFFKSSTGFVKVNISEVSVGMIYFIIWLLFGIAAAFITGVLSFVDFLVKRTLATPIIGSILLTVGLYELFYLLYGINLPLNYDNTYLRWFLSRVIYLSLLTTGTAYFSFINKKKIRNSRTKKYRLYLLFTACFFVLSAAITLTFFEAKIVIQNTGSFINHPLEVFIIIANLVLGIYILPNFTKRFPSLFSRLLLLSILPAALADIFMVLHKDAFDLYFNTAYFLRLINYLIPLLGIGINYIDTSRKEKKIIYQLQTQIQERIKAQHDLVKREALLANAERIAHLGSWEYNTETLEVRWSDEMYAIFGKNIKTYTPSLEITDEVVIESYIDKVRFEIGQAVANNTSYSVEFQIKRADGSIRCLLGQGYYSKEEKKLISTILDITELKEATFKLAQSEALLKEAEALSHNGSWQWSPEKNAFYWSDELYRIHGLEPDSAEIDLRFYLTLIHPDDVQHFVTVLADTQNTLSPFSINYRIIREDGSVRYLTLNGKFKTDFSGNVNQVLGNTQDITELKSTSQLLERSESIYRTIARNVPDSAVFLFDNKLNLLLTEGPALESIDSEGIITSVETFHEAIFKENILQTMKLMHQALDGFESKLEIKIHQKIFKITFTTVYLSGGEVFGVMVVMHDITDIKKAQQALEVKVAELNRSNKDLEQFAYIASHDLQEPLRKIRAFGERLKIKFSGSLPEEGLDYIRRMANASERMQLLIDDLLTFSRISRPSEELQPLNLEATIEQVIQDLEYSIEKKKATVKIAVKHSLKVIPLQLRQLFQNLFSNSLKFAREGESLVIEVYSEVVEGNTFPQLKFDKRYCKIEIIDNGIGFDNQFSHKIFTLFHRLHSKNEYEGTGIGLAICKKIVENHDGVIEAEGKEGQGALFRIFLPIE